MEVRGRDLIAGLPRTIPITSSEVMEAIEPPLQQLVAAVRLVLEQTPPELTRDIIDKGMVMSGGGALLRNIDKLLTQVTGRALPRGRERAQLRRARHRPRPGALRLLQEVARPAGLTRRADRRDSDASRGAAFIDLHCHTSASFDSLASPRGQRPGGRRVRGLTHLAITDHDRIDGALRARDAAPAGLTVIVGEEVKTADGDLIAIFLEQAGRRPACRLSRRSPRSASRAAWSGCPHPFDRYRDSLAAREPAAIAGRSSTGSRSRTPGSSGRTATSRPPSSPSSTACPGVAVSDAHSTLEVGGRLQRPSTGDPSTPAGLLAALATSELVTGRASYFVRAHHAPRQGRPVDPGQRPGRAGR